MFNYLQDSTSHPRDKEMLDLFDSAGTKSQIEFKEWRTKVVPEYIKINWNNSAGLAEWILNGLTYQLWSEIDEASQRLMEIDNNKERAICYRVSVLMNLKRYNDIENIIFKYLENYPKTGVILTNLAKAQMSLNKIKEAIATLEEGLKLEPNQDNGLVWWVALNREFEKNKLNISEDAAHLISLTNANEKFGGWRVKQYLGSFFANQKQVAIAIEWFNKALKEKGWENDLLLAITGHLGKNGFIEDAVKIAEPIYEPNKDNVYVGINLVQFYLELKQIDKAQHLLDKLFAIRNSSIEKILLEYQAKCNEIRSIKN